jgi:hypothetical protein
LDAHDGALLVAYEGDDGRVVPPELADLAAGPTRGGALAFVLA